MQFTKFNLPQSILWGEIIIDPDSKYPQGLMDFVVTNPELILIQKTTTIARGLLDNAGGYGESERENPIDITSPSPEIPVRGFN